MVRRSLKSGPNIINMPKMRIKPNVEGHGPEHAAVFAAFTQSARRSLSDRSPAGQKYKQGTTAA